jgi:hypothetical protein
MRASIDMQAMMDLTRNQIPDHKLQRFISVLREFGDLLSKLTETGRMAR